MINNNVEFDVYLNNRPVTYYEHRENATTINTFLEGRAGSVYTLKITNRNPYRVLAVPSVDGLSVLDGKPASTNSRGYILGAYDTLEIPGWLVDDKTAAKFTFGTVKSSYGAKTGQDENNVGVIGLVVWTEKVYVSIPQITTTYTFRNDPFRSYDWNDTSTSSAGGTTRRKSLHGSGGVGATPSWQAQNMSGVAQASMSNNAAMMSGTQNINATFTMDSQPVTQKLGTEFGSATKFDTVTQNFEKDYILCMMELFYDDAVGLAERGIYVNGPKAIPRPKAFPKGTGGCVPPTDWRK